VNSTAASFTSHRKPCNYSEPKLFSRAKPAYFDFFHPILLCRMTYYEPLWLVHLKKVLELWRFPSTKVFTPNLETYKSQYQPTYVGFKRTMLGEHMGQSETLLGTCWVTHWELDVNTMGTWWEHIGNTKGPTPLHPPHKKKKFGSIGCMLHGLIFWV